jgi:hypothetical protein
MPEFSRVEWGECAFTSFGKVGVNSELNPLHVVKEAQCSVLM